MRKLIFILLFLLFSFLNLQAQPQYSIVGKWKAIDDTTGNATAVIEIKEDKGKYSGKIIEVLAVDSKDSKCENCKGKDWMKTYKGLTIMKNVVKEKDNKYSGGTIFDPETGAEYKCSLKLVGYSKLEVSGISSVLLFKRSQTWTKQP
ncbi:DUF2147 domain-containing protein [Myroides sp. WP-1]|uniref:DUF2147 domain-containing protein n=1 Tax=Myroides sp. WP-1 TaxID=2759944 RepID=UPI0015FD0591|nr:DUF2147 domain-containing protein [Myroides sp. WP-1]MBB1139214.1 DUF2147 domain-containing protein [Myroides sp. WP-1]